MKLTFPFSNQPVQYVSAQIPSTGAYVVGSESAANSPRLYSRNRRRLSDKTVVESNVPSHPTDGRENAETEVSKAEQSVSLLYF